MASRFCTHSRAATDRCAPHRASGHGNTLYGSTEAGYTGPYASGGVVFSYTL
jgi:hypothetical protein